MQTKQKEQRMIKNLFRRKPIYQVILATQPTEQEYKSWKKQLQDDLGDDYRVVIIVDNHKTYIETKLLK